MNGSGTVRLDTALRAAHQRCGLRYIEFLPVTQQERLPLTCGQFSNFVVDQMQDLGPGNRVGSALAAELTVQRVQSFEKIEIAIVTSIVEVRQVLDVGTADFLAPEPVHRGVGQDALEDQRQFGSRPVGVFLSQLDHRVLDDVQCRIVAPDCVHGALEGAPFDTLEEVGEFFFGGQRVLGGLQAQLGPSKLSHRTAAGRDAPKAADDGAIMLHSTTRYRLACRPSDRDGASETAQAAHRAGSEAASRGRDRGAPMVFR